MVQFPDVDEQVDISMKNPILTNSCQKINKNKNTHTQKKCWLFSKLLLTLNIFASVDTFWKQKKVWNIKA